MGDLQTDQGEALELRFVQRREFGGCWGAPRAPVARAREFAALARINTLYMIAGAWSGHIGTSFSWLEIMSWLYLNEMRDLDKGPEACDVFFWSKGHDVPALYSVLIGLGLLPPTSCTSCGACTACPAIPTSRRRTSRPTPGRSAWASRRPRAWRSPTGWPARPRRIFVLTGDGELQEGQFWESLGVGGEPRPGRDHRDRRPQQDPVRHLGDEVSHLGDLEEKLRAFGWHVGRCDGHDVAALERMFRALDARDGAAEGDDRRHHQGARRVLHGGPGDEGGRALPLSLGRAR